MVEAAGVGLCGRVENKQLIESKGPPETQETANTRFSSTLQVHGIWQSSRVLSPVPIRVGLQLENSRRQELVLSPSAQLQRIPVTVQFMSTAVDPGSWR
jgi:hypothetical protein